MSERIGPTGCWLLADEPHAHDWDVCCAIIRFLRTHHITCILDLGCGNGQYGRWIRDHGIIVVEMDGNPHTPEITNNYGMVVDLSKPINFMEGLYDFVMSLEVGEHIPGEYEQVYLDNVTKHTGKYLLLSWAVENQPGLGHVNCRNNDYIIAQLERRGFTYNEEMTAKLRSVASLPWFKDTLMFFVKKTTV